MACQAASNAPATSCRGPPATNARTRSAKGRPPPLAGDQAEGLEDAADLVGEVDAHAHQLRAGDEQGADQVAVHALDRHLAVPAGAHNLRQTACIVAVGLVQLQGERRLDVPSVEADYGQA